MKQQVSARFRRAMDASRSSLRPSPAASRSRQFTSFLTICWAMGRSSRVTTNVRSWASSAAGSTRSAMAFDETMTPRAPLWLKTWRWSATVLVANDGTVMAPIDMMARSAMGHSGRFSATRATRSHPQRQQPPGHPAHLHGHIGVGEGSPAGRAFSPEERSPAEPPALGEKHRRQALPRLELHLYPPLSAWRNPACPLYR